MVQKPARKGAFWHFPKLKTTFRKPAANGAFKIIDVSTESLQFDSRTTLVAPPALNYSESSLFSQLFVLSEIIDKFACACQAVIIMETLGNLVLFI